MSHKNINWICSECQYSNHPCLPYCEKCETDLEQKTYNTEAKNTEVTNYNGWNCYRCHFRNHSALRRCEMCSSSNNMQMMKIEQLMERKLANFHDEFEKKLSAAPANCVLEIKVKYPNSRWNCSTCGCRKSVQIFKMGELGVTLKRDEYKKQVIVERTQKKKKVLFFTVSSSDETHTKIIESHRWKDAELTIYNLPIAIGCMKCGDLMKFAHGQKVTELLVNYMLK